MKHIAVLTSGGDAPGMNAAIRAVTRSALDEGMTVSGVLQGWQGLVEGQFRQLSARDVGGIIQVGGTFLGSARSAEFPEESGRSKALRNLAQRGIDGVVVIGGNGSQTGSYMLSQLGVHVVGIASTIDNDLLGTDISIGCDTAINVTLEAIDHLRTTGSSHNRAFLVETMGRDCGYLAMMAGLAGGAEVISTPEFEVPASDIAPRLRAAANDNAAATLADARRWRNLAARARRAAGWVGVGDEALLTRLVAPVDPPYQPLTAAKSSDWPTTCAVRRNGPLPTSVSGLVYQTSSPAAVTTFLSTSHIGHRPTSVSQ